MSNYTILKMSENPRRGRQARNFTTNAPKILDLKSSSEQIFSRKLPLGAPVVKMETKCKGFLKVQLNVLVKPFNTQNQLRSQIILTFKTAQIPL